MEVAKRYPNITFCVSKEEDYLEELKDLKLEDSGEDVNVALFLSPKRRYAMTPNEDFDSEVLNAFVEDVLNGRAEPVIKSQPVPHNEGPVVSVVGETFDSLVMKSEKDVLIEFYAQWCRHCQQLEPIYRQLAQKLLSSHKELVVAKIDASLNDFPDLFEVKGFPTIYLLRKTEKSDPIVYSGDNSLESLFEFVSKMVSNKREEL